jgi:hypothetical protein
MSLVTKAGVGTSAMGADALLRLLLSPRLTAGARARPRRGLLSRHWRVCPRAGSRWSTAISDTPLTITFMRGAGGRFLLARRVGGGDGAAFLAFVLIRSSRHCVCDGQIDGKTAGRPAARVQLVLRARTAMEADLALGFPLAVPSFIGQSPLCQKSLCLDGAGGESPRIR